MSNLTNNRLNVTMNTSQFSVIKTAILTIQTNMPFLIGLNVEERMQLPKINVVNKVFTEDAVSAAANNIALLPIYINAVDMQNDLTLFTQLDEIASLLRQVLEKVEDTQMLAGSEAYVAALAAYKLFGAASDAGLAGADAVYDQLKQRFIGQGGSGTPPTP